MIDRVDLGDVLARLEPLQQRVVALLYDDGRTPTEVACLLSVELTVVAAALAIAYRQIAPWVLDGPHEAVPGVIATSA